MAQEFAKRFYKSQAWQNVRSHVLKRDFFLCVKCGHPAEEVHHIIHLNPNNIHDPSIALNEKNLISLCRDCHFDEHRIDKLKGIQKKKEQKEEDSEYVFDENGYLVRRNTPPIKDS